MVKNHKIKPARFLVDCLNLAIFNVFLWEDL